MTPELLTMLAALSLLLLLGSALAVPLVIRRMPADYLVRKPDPAARPPVLGLLRRIARNALGALLLLAGVAMLALPGQGLLTILAGLLLLDFPGKRRFERWLLGIGPVRRTVAAIRRRAGQDPLEL